MESFMVRTRKVNATDFRGARIRVECVADSGTGWGARTLAYNFAAENPHVGALIEYLNGKSIDSFRADWVRETRSGRGNIYRVSVGGAE